MRSISSSTTVCFRQRRTWFVVLTVAAIVLTIQLQGASLRSALAALERHRSPLGMNGQLPPKTVVDWSPTAALPIRTGDDYLHVAVPAWLAGIVSNPVGRWFAAPFGRIDQVRLRGSNAEALAVLGRCPSLREVELFEVRGGSEAVWHQLLSLPLQYLFVDDCGLPRHAFLHLSRKARITSLTLIQEGPLDFIGLSQCDQLRRLQLVALKDVPDESIAAELRQLRMLQSVLMVGVGEQTVAALEELPVLEEVVLHRCDARPQVFEGFAKLENLKSISLSQCRIDDSVLSHLGTIRSLRRCFVQGETVTEAAVEAFREQRPNMELTLLGGLDWLLK
jgi:hypothetical protein